jgi:hypothetical protein
MDGGKEVIWAMCATCGCLTSGAPAPMEGTYKCVECEKAGQSYHATVKKGDAMPKCDTCKSEKAHWIKV